MHALTTAAVQNLPLLRRLQQGGVESKSTLAAEVNRDPSNLNRALKALEADGLISGLALTEAGERVLLAADVADGKTNPVRETEPAARVWTHADLTPNPDQPRKEFDPEQLDQLAATIAEDGQLQNILARPNPDKHGPALQIVGGERRYRAMGLLIERGLWPADHPVKVEVRDLTDAQVDALALIENMQRADLSFLEEARAFHRLFKTHGWSTTAIAEKVNKTARFVQYRLKLLRLTEAEQRQLEDGDITFKQALAIIDKRPEPLDLTPAQLLIVAEVVAAAAGLASAAHWMTAECDPIAAAAAIEAHQLGDALKLTGPHVETGAFSIGFTGETYFARVAAQHPDLIGSSRASALRSIRARASTADDAEEADDTGKHLTPWLNGPFPLTPEGRAAKEAHEQRQRDKATAQAQEEARLALQQQQLEEAHAAADNLIATRNTKTAAPAIAEHQALAAALEAAGSPLPWRVEVSPRDSANLVDRDGKPIDLMWGGIARHIRNKLIMAAVNAAAGHAPAVVDVAIPSAEQASEEPAEACAACEAARANAKAAGHRDWRDGVCFEHAGVTTPSDDGLETVIAEEVARSGLPEHVVRKSFEQAGT